MGYNYTIKSIKRADCTEFLAKHHYLSQQGYSYRSGFNYGLYDDKDKLIGVAVFHTVSAWETVKGCFGLENKEQKGFWELGRFALDDEHHGMNLGSWFLSRCIKRLRKDTEVRALISYADADLHNGGLYAATNFKYYGLTAPKSDFWVKQDDGTFKKKSRGATRDFEGQWRPRSRKHRYLMIFDKSLTTRWREEAYPKN
jgi:GNAT superfamily N-acetyltransferase